MKPISCHWVFKKKYDQNGVLTRHKARLVANGSKQQYGIDYEETFAPVVKFITLRLLLALCAFYDWECDHIDFDTAFLNGILQEIVYMFQPPGFVSKAFPNRVLRLIKTIYGLKQSPCEWYRALHAYLVSQGFQRLDTDNGLYIRKNGEKMIILAVYVDDLLIFGNDKPEIKLFKERIAKEFKVKDLGPVKFIVGMEVQRDRKARTIKVVQCQYAKDLLERFHMDRATPSDTPEESSKILTKDGFKDHPKSKPLTTEPYLELVGALIYLMVCTRPDLAHSVGVLSRYMSDPKRDHWNAAKRVLRYIKNTTDVGIVFGGQQKLRLEGYSDSSFANDIDDRKSTAGYGFMLNNGIISWSSKKQPTVAQSTTEAEYMGLSTASAEAVWLNNLLVELGFRTPNEPVKLYGDNQGSLMLSTNPKYHNRTKHIDIIYHHIRELIERKKIDLEYMPTKMMLAYRIY